MAIHQKKNGNQAVRPPIVVVMGHVDHGKSSLLEAIREDFRIVAKEAGGITQQIGAYEAEYQGKKLTFIDTPGHEAFSAMRSRGAKVADIALLVVAADEGVKAQTKEALAQIREARIPFIVVANKMDRPGADVDRLKQNLAQADVLVEGYGGDIPLAETSATTKQGIPELLELILLVAEMTPPQGSPEGPGEGIVIESTLDPKRGPVATLLVRKGTLGTGDFVGTPSSKGKARLLEDFQGKPMKQALPSQPARIIGLESPPSVGDEFRAFLSKEEAGQFSQASSQKERVEEREEAPEDVIRIVLKADTGGSLEALEQAVGNVPQDLGSIRVIRGSVGDITENDILFAKGAQARIIGFRIKVSSRMQEIAERSGVPLTSFPIIYEATDHLLELLKWKAQGEMVREDKGEARLLAIFRTGKEKHIIGGTVLSGEVRKGMEGEIVRNDEVIGEGKVLDLQRQKEKVSFVPEGEEFGMEFRSDTIPQEQDILRFFVENPRGM